MSKRKLELELTIDGKQANIVLNNVDSAVNSLTRNTKSAGAALGNVGNIVTGLNSAFNMVSGITNTFYNVLTNTIEMYKVEEQAIKSLDVALGYHNETLVEFASAMQKVTTHGDEEIIQAEALIAMFVKDEDQIKALTKATLDLADAKGMDLSSAADLVAKTMGSSTNALARYGIEVEGSVGSSERLDSLLRSLNDKFEGQSTAKAQTETGKLTQAENALSDSMEKVGKVAVTIIEPISTAFSLITGSMVDFLLPVQTNLQKVEESSINQRMEFYKLTSSYENLKSKTNLTAEEQDKYNSVINELYKKYPSILGQYDLHKGKLDDIRKGFGLVRDEMIKTMRVEIQSAKAKDVVAEQEDLIDQKLLLLTEIDEIDAKIKAKLNGDDKDADIYDKATQTYIKSSDMLKRQRQIINQDIKDIENDIIEAQNRLNGILRDAGSSNAQTTTTTGSEKKPTGGGGKKTTDEIIEPIDVAEIFDVNEWQKAYDEVLQMEDDFSAELTEASQQRVDEMAEIRDNAITEMGILSEAYYEREKQKIEKAEEERIEAGVGEVEAHALKLQEMYELDSQYAQAVGEITSGIAGGLSDAFGNIANLIADNERADIDAAKNRDLKNLESKRKEALAYAKTEAEKDKINIDYDAKKAAIEAEADKRAKNAASGWFLASKAASVINATVKTYEAATVALASAPPPWNYALAAAVTAAGLTNVAVIASQSVPAFAEGVTNFSGGMALVGEEGPELVTLPNGANVYTNSDTENMIRRIESSNNLVNRIESNVSSSNNDGWKILNETIKEQTIRLENVERRISFSEFDEGYSNFKQQNSSVGI